jgi:hypothetical protein
MKSDGVNFPRQKKIDEDPNLEGSDLTEDLYPSVKKLFFMETNRILC